MKHIFNTQSKKVLGDLHTPVSIYLKVRDIYPESVLLESSDFHGNENALSFIALQPIARFEVKNNIATETFPNGEARKTDITPENNVISLFNGFLSSFEISGDEKNSCGLFGYTSFDSVNLFDQIKPAAHRTDAIDLPDMLYILYKHIIVVNHFKNELTLIELIQDNESNHLNNIESLIENRNYASYNFALTGDEKSTIDDEQYRQMVKKGIEHCLRGDVFQIVLARRFSRSFHGEDFKVYRALRSVNPSPYLFYFDFGSFRIFGSSPETHCRIANRIASIDPIAGTVKRTGDVTKDKDLTRQLVEDPKENAEHVMLVDLARNDLSRNCENVKIDFYKEVQYYSHVIHLVSRVSGALLAEHNSLRTFADTFPAGTLSGAPKINAIELIQSIEPHLRSAYGGCIGFIGFNGDLNQAITIRSFISKGNTLYYQAGAGVVAKSTPEGELQEVNHKLNALRNALELAGQLKN